jgi:hypothetical protein
VASGAITVNAIYAELRSTSSGDHRIVSGLFGGGAATPTKINAHRSPSMVPPAGTTVNLTISSSHLVTLNGT